MLSRTFPFSNLHCWKFLVSQALIAENLSCFSGFIDTCWPYLLRVKMFVFLGERVSSRFLIGGLTLYEVCCFGREFHLIFCLWVSQMGNNIVAAISATPGFAAPTSNIHIQLCPPMFERECRIWRAFFQAGSSQTQLEGECWITYYEIIFVFCL